MARDAELRRLRDAAIRRDYERLRRRKARPPIPRMVYLLSTRYYLSERRIEAILWG